MSSTRKCSSCGKTKKLTYKYWKPRTPPKRGFRSPCRRCLADRMIPLNKARIPQTHDERRFYWLRRKHGITQERYEEMLLEQGGRCRICHSLPEGSTWGVLAVDHNHETGRVRGLLCNQCNTALGLFGENETTLVNAIRYLRKYA